jgi:hypothetical protein
LDVVPLKLQFVSEGVRARRGEERTGTTSVRTSENNRCDTAQRGNKASELTGVGNSLVAPVVSELSASMVDAEATE